MRRMKCLFCNIEKVTGKNKQKVGAGLFRFRIAIFSKRVQWFPCTLFDCSTTCAEKSEAARAAYLEKLAELPKEKRAYIDESSINCGMTRLYGHVFSNKRVNDYVPDIRFERTSVIANKLIVDMDYNKFICKCARRGR